MRAHPRAVRGQAERKKPCTKRMGLPPLPVSSDASLLLRNSPNRTTFFNKRLELDPLGKFQNEYTLEMQNNGSRSFPVDTRSAVWKVFVWLSFCSSLLVCIYLCYTQCCSRAFVSKRSKTTPTSYEKITKEIPQKMTARNMERAAQMRRR